MHGHVDDANVTSNALEGLTEEQTERLTELLDRYLASLEAGQPLSREALLEEHADLRASLSLYLDKLSELHNFSAGFSPHLAGASSSAPIGSRSSNALFREPTRRDAAHLTPPERLRTSHDRNADATRFDPDVPDMPDEHWALATEGSTARRLGDFELLRVIGRGGMGVVYEAEQLSLRRKVALKLLPLTSLLDSRQIARFKNEAQAAAALQHPNIVPVYAVGSYQGIHYYAMPLIDGYPLDAIIAALRQRKNTPLANVAISEGDQGLGADSQADELSAADGWEVPTDVRRVISLGIEAASALAAAHEEGIIHRDIKPSNLLLDRSGKLWVTDFGLARRVNDHSLTATGDVLGTLRYMSPEQASGRGALVDSRSDIYSLGVTLYELLALTPAVAGGSSPSLLRAIEQHTPVSLRHLRPDLPRDLITVIETAMAKDPYERYHTAQALADDLVRVLEGRPTLAKPPSLLTRVIKWAARHHRWVAAGVLVFLFASLGLGVSTSIIIQKNAIAREHAAAAQKASRTLAELVGRGELELQRLKDIPGAEEVRRNLLSAFVDSHRSFVDEFRDEPSSGINIAKALMRLGTLHGELGEFKTARSQLDEAYSLLTSLVAFDPDDPDYRRELAICANQQGRVLVQLGAIVEAEAFARKAVELQEELTVSDSENTNLAAELAQSRNNLALLLAAKKEPDAAKANEADKEAERLLVAARSELLHLIEEAPEQLKYQELLAATYNNLCSILGQRDPAAAAHLYELSLAAQQKVLDASPNQLPPRRRMAVTYSNLGKARTDAGQLDQAKEAYGNAITIQRQLIAVAPLYRPYISDLSVSLNNLGRALAKQKLQNEAEACFQEAIDWQLRLLQQTPDDASVAHELGGIYNNLAESLQGSSNVHAVDAAFESAIAYQRQARQLAPKVNRYRDFLDKHLVNYSAWLKKTHRYEQALAIALERRILWAGNAGILVGVASDLAEDALSIASDSNRQGVAQRYADAVMETLGLAQKAGLVESHGVTIRQVLSQYPFSSLGKINSPTD